MLQITSTSEVMPTLLQGRMPTLLQGGFGDANVDTLNQFSAMLKANPNATVYTSKGEGSGAGSTDDGITFLVIPTTFFVAVSDALAAAGNARLGLSALTDQEQFIPDVGSRVGTAAFLAPVVSSAITTLVNGSTSNWLTTTNVLIGVGAIAVVGGIAMVVISKRKHRGLTGARRRRGR